MPSPLAKLKGEWALTFDLKQSFEAYQKGNYKDAEPGFTHAVNSKGDADPVLLFYLGTIYMLTNRCGLGVPLFKNAIAIKEGKFPEAWNNLGTCYRLLNQAENARRAYNKSIQQDENNADPLCNIGTLHINEGSPADGLKYLNRAISLNPNHPKARWNRSLANLELENWRDAWADYDFGFEAGERMMRGYGATEPNGKDPVPLWDGTPGKTVVVWGEQGIGDEIMFASMIPEMQKICKQVIFDCHPRLEDIFKKSFPGIEVYGTRKQDIITWPLKYKIDAKIAIGSLGKFLRNKPEDFPVHNGYLQPDFLLRQKHREKIKALGNRPKIGISWIGGKTKTRQDLRSVSLETLLPILKHNADFISLQYTNCSKEIADFEAKHGIKINHWQEEIDDYDETTALVSNLDLVISVCTSAIHLSGGLNVPCWIITPSRPAWRYHLKGEKMAWYDSIRMFRQEDGETWEPAILKIASELEKFLESHKENNKAYDELTAAVAAEVALCR